ncbi:MAG: O-antigen ligase family protein [Salibacteraceae bacterium]
MKSPWFDRLEQLMLLVLSGFVIWPNAVSSIALIVLFVIAILRSQRKVLPSKKEWWLFLLPCCILFSWLLHGMATDGFRDLQLWGTWIAAIIYFRLSRFQSLFLQFFVLVSSIYASVFLLWLVLSDPIPALNFAQLLRDQVQESFHVHPTYLSALWFGATLIVITNLERYRWWHVIMLTLLIIAGLFAGGKMPFLALCVALVAYFFYRLKTGRWLAMLGIMSVATAMVFFNPVLRERVNEFKNVEVDYSKGQWLSSTELRIGIWRCAIKSIKENWLVGVGLGNTRNALDACYAQYEQSQFFETEFNEHNQLMHFWLSGGVFSALGFILFFLLLLRFCKKEKRLVLMLFTFYFLMISLTENYLSRQHGMMFWSFITMALLTKEKERLPFLSKPSSM